MAKRLYEAAGQPKELWMIQGADHYEAMEEMGDQTHPRLLEFFENCVNKPPQTATAAARDHS